MRLSAVFFLLVCLVAAFWLVMVVGAAKGDRGLSERPSPLPGQSARGDARSESAAEGPAGRDSATSAGVGRSSVASAPGPVPLLAEGPAGGMASSYGPGLWGNRLGCGGRLWRTTVAVAHKSLPCGTALRVCWRNRCLRALVRDRGPYVTGRSLDLTEALVRRFGFASARSFGVRYVEWMPA